MSRAYQVFRKEPLTLKKEFAEVAFIASQLEEYLSLRKVCREIRKHHRPNTPSQQIQAIIHEEVERLGFQSEKRGLFSNYAVPALRPDFYRRVGRSGIILEVERGRTLANNMDLLDLWKCHICAHADFLYLIIPVERQTWYGRTVWTFDRVLRRLSTFFEPRNYVNVEAVFVFGY